MKEFAVRHNRATSRPFFIIIFWVFFNSFGAILCVFSPMRVLVPV